MNYYEIPRDSTSQMIEFDVFDSSSSVGARLAGLVYNTGSLTACYNRQNAAGAATAITLVTMTKGTWVSGGFVAVDGTNMPGVYQLCLPDAAVAAAAGVNFVTVVLKGAANMVPVVLNIRLSNWVASTTPANTLTVTSNKVAATIAAGDIANDAITAAAIAAGALAAIADKLLGRAVAGAADGGRTVSTALAQARNRVKITGSSNPFTMTVYAADDAATLWTAAVTIDAVTGAITEIDPA